ncbi:hypothetical protein [Hymenobacter algoricola]
MRAFRSHLAVLLLLCFVRVLLPDGWVLNLHAHDHTTELAPARIKAAKVVLTAKHQHCQTHHFCALPFQPAMALEFTLLPGYSRPRATAPVSVWTKITPAARQLRGPPTRA